MSIDKIRQLRLYDPILNAAYKAYPDEDEAIRVALLAHIENNNTLIDRLVKIVSTQPLAVFKLDSGKKHESPEVEASCSKCGLPLDPGCTCINCSLKRPPSVGEEVPVYGAPFFKDLIKEAVGDDDE